MNRTGSDRAEWTDRWVRLCYQKNAQPANPGTIPRPREQTPGGLNADNQRLVTWQIHGIMRHDHLSVEVGLDRNHSDSPIANGIRLSQYALTNDASAGRFRFGQRLGILSLGRRPPASGTGLENPVPIRHVFSDEIG